MDLKINHVFKRGFGIMCKLQRMHTERGLTYKTTVRFWRCIYVCTFIYLLIYLKCS